MFVVKTKGILKGLNGLETGYKNPYLERTEWGGRLIRRDYGLP